MKSGQLQRIVVNRTQIDASWVQLNPSQQHYLFRVLRLQKGDRVLIMDGQGQTWLAQLVDDAAELLELVVLQTELPISLQLWIAPPKGNGFEDIIRQATEVGVTVIHPLLSDRTLLQPSDQKRDRWRRIAEESAEQSERQSVVQLADPVRFADAEFLKPSLAAKYLTVTRQEAPHLLNCLQRLPSQRSETAVSDIWIATGPEGGWTEAEVNAAIAAGVQCVSLGKRILRAVTAPVVAATLVAAVWESQPHG